MRSFVKFKPSNSSGDSRKFGEAYYARELKTLRPFRLFGACGSFIALTLTVIGICSSHWVQGTGKLCFCFVIYFSPYKFPHIIPILIVCLIAIFMFNLQDDGWNHICGNIEAIIYILYTMIPCRLNTLTNPARCDIYLLPNMDDCSL